MVSNASKKDIGRCYKFITKELEQAMGTIHAADYMRRFGSRLGLANKDMQAAEEAANTACPRDGRWATAIRWEGEPECERAILEKLGIRVAKRDEALQRP